MVNKQIDALSGFRFLPAVGVLLVHLRPLGSGLLPSTTPFWFGLEHAAYVVVDIFFMLSGFVIYHGYGELLGERPAPSDYGRYLWMRLARLYPTHLAILLVMVLGFLGSSLIGKPLPHAGSFGSDFIQQLLLVHGWGFASHLSWNGPTWAMSSLWACYLVFPVMAYVVRRVQRPGSAVIGYGIALVAMFVIYNYLGTDSAHLTYIAPLWRAFADFLCGCLMYRLYRSSPRITAALGRVAIPLLVATGVCSWLLLDLGLPPLWSVVLIGPTIVGFAHNQGLARSLFGSAPAKWAGDVSFAVYMVQVPCLLMLQIFVTPRLFHGPFLGAIGIGLVLTIVVISSLVVRRFVEGPGHRAMKHIWEQRRSSQSKINTGREAAIEHSS